MERAYSVFEVKSLNDEQRVISGIATTPTPDRIGDIIDPRGVKVATSIPLLLYHDQSKPVGTVRLHAPTDSGIEFEARIPKVIEAGTLRDRVDEAWQLVKYRLIAAVSIGFRPTIDKIEQLKSGGLRYKESEVLELSLVPVPANAEATITAIKQYDKLFDTASGVRSVVANTPPGASGNLTYIPKGKAVKSIQEQMIDFQNKRTSSMDRMSAIMDSAAEAGTTLDESQTEEYDGLESEVKAIDAHLARLKAHETIMIAKATPISQETGRTGETASQARGGNVISIRNNLPKGTAFARYAQALAFSKGNLMQAHEISKRWRDTTPEVETVLKAAMTAGTTSDSDWAMPLTEYQTMADEFIDLLRPATIIGRLPGLRRVPFNIRVAGKTQGSTVGWVGQGAPKPVSELKFNDVTLGFAKAAGIVVISQELARFSSPSAEALIRQDLIDAMAEFLDVQFITPAVAAVANVSPASITNGLTPVTGTGPVTIATHTADVAAAFNKFITANLAPANGVWIMSPGKALTLSMLRTAQDVFAFPDLTMNGGTFFGLPVVVSKSVPATIMVLADTNEIFLADDGGVRLDVSEQASLQMDSVPSAGAAALVSLWQQNLVGIRAERFINWKRRRDAAVTYITDYVAP